uniref:Uncharacterized protein n=1 Tax=Rousettus aegyptiacus TaxID=9407 RepID=A0A7J8BFD5_ROUAE|nr:hypothetical protein HJG63_009678 [Rousettus aegyptiacus]
MHLMLVGGKDDPQGPGSLLQGSQVGQPHFQLLTLFPCGPNSFQGPLSASFPLPCSLQAVWGSSPNLALKSLDRSYLFSLGCPLPALPACSSGLISIITTTSMKQAPIQSGIDCFLLWAPTAWYKPFHESMDLNCPASESFLYVCVLLLPKVVLNSNQMSELVNCDGQGEELAVRDLSSSSDSTIM